MTMRPRVEGQDLQGMTLWEGYELRENEWISTGRKHLLVTHFDLPHLIGFYLEYYPITASIRYSTDAHYQFVSVPSAVPTKLGQIVTDQLLANT